MTNDERLMSEIFNGLFERPKDIELEESCEVIFKLYQSFIKAGFTDAQAFSLVTEILKGGIK